VENQPAEGEAVTPSQGRGRPVSNRPSALKFEAAVKAYLDNDTPLPAWVTQDSGLTLSPNGLRIMTFPEFHVNRPVFVVADDGSTAQVVTLRLSGAKREIAEEIHATLAAADYAPKQETA